MSAREFAYWQRFDLTDPIGAERLDWLAASIASAVANYSGLVEHPVHAENLLLKFEDPDAMQEEVEADNGDEIDAMFHRVNASIEGS